MADVLRAGSVIATEVTTSAANPGGDPGGDPGGGTGGGTGGDPRRRSRLRLWRQTRQ